MQIEDITKYLYSSKSKGILIMLMKDTIILLMCITYFKMLQSLIEFAVSWLANKSFEVNKCDIWIIY